MATPIIRSVGSTSGAATGTDRDDLVIGETVTLTDTAAANAGHAYSWAFIDKPVESAASITNPTSATASFIPDVTGSYKVRCTVDGTTSSSKIMGVVLSMTGARIPAFREEEEYAGGGNTKGWHPSLTKFMRETDRLFSESSRSAFNVSRYGVVADGTTNDTAAMQSAINATKPDCRLYIPAGTIRLTAPLNLDGVATLVFSGADEDILYASHAPTFNTYEISGHMFTSTNGVLPSTTLSGIRVLGEKTFTIVSMNNSGLYGNINVTTSVPHGINTQRKVTVSGALGDTAANGRWDALPVDSTTVALNGSTGNAAYTGGGKLSVYSTTWRGVFPPAADNYINSNLRIANCHIRGSQYVGARGLDFTGVVGGSVENTQVLGFERGHATYFGYNYVNSTTVVLRKVYLGQSTECITSLGAYNIDCHDVTLETANVGACAYQGHINFFGGWFEGLGNSDSYGAAITTQAMGIGNGSNSPIDTAFHFRGGQVDFFGSYFSNSLHTWFRGVGLAQTYGQSGGALFHHCHCGDPIAGFFAHSDANREDYVYEVYDTSELIAGSAPIGVAKKYADAREVTRGTVNVMFSNSAHDFRAATVVDGKFRYDSTLFTSNVHGAAWTSGFSVYPEGGQNSVGDVVMVTAPTAGGYIGYVCTTAGTPGTWKGFGAIQA